MRGKLSSLMRLMFCYNETIHISQNLFEKQEKICHINFSLWQRNTIKMAEINFEVY